MIRAELRSTVSPLLLHHVMLYRQGIFAIYFLLLKMSVILT
jgi:hypothetical protein